MTDDDQAKALSVTDHHGHDQNRTDCDSVTRAHSLMDDRLQLFGTFNNTLCCHFLIFGLRLAWIFLGDGRTLGNNVKKWIEGYK